MTCVTAGTVAPAQSVTLELTYDITQNTFQTVLQAAVLITTSGRPAAKVSFLMLSTAILACILHVQQRTTAH